MNKLLILTLSFSFASCLVTNRQVEQSGDFCDSLRKEMVKVEDMKEVRNQMFLLLKCGFDSSDCKLAFPVAGTIIAKKQANITMGELMDTLKVVKALR